MKRKLNAQDIPEPAADVPAATTPATKPSSKPTFASLGLDARIIQAVNREKFATPTPVQIKAIPLALSGTHILARAKTGSGKTLAYLLPILHAILQRKAANRRAKSTTALILVPSKELATQVSAAVKTFTTFCAQDVRCENITRKEDVAVTKARLTERPDIVVATPTTANQWVNSQVLEVDELKHLVIDEADLVLTYGHQEDLESIAQVLPLGVHKMLLSATLRTEVDTVTSLFFDEQNKPEILDFSAEEAAERTTLAQYTVRTAEDEKFLMIYAIFKLQLIKGKVIIFVADIDRCYRVKLFLEQIGVRSCVLNSELPVNSRLHVVEEFNRGVYDIIIAADEAEVNRDDGSKRKKRKIELEDEAEKEEKEPNVEEHAKPEAAKENDAEEQDEVPTTQKPAKKPKQEPRHKTDREYGVSRGIDFRHVTCVLNFDLPTTSKSYTHRIGRTARAGNTGMALSFVVPRELYRKHKSSSIPQCEKDEEALKLIIQKQVAKGAEVKEWGLDRSKLDGFRYRLESTLRSVTRIAVREARTRELRNELITSEKLKRHFEENPEDLRHLRHDTESHAIRAQPHLKHVPEYLLPSGGKQAVSKDVGFVGFKKDARDENKIRKARALNKARGKGRIAKGKGMDPLKSLNARGRGKK